MKSKAYIIISVALIVGGITYGIVTRNKRKKMIDQINDKLDKGTGSSGTYTDLGKSKAFNPNYWKEVRDGGKTTKYLKSDFAKKYAKQIYDALDGWDNEDAVFSVIKGARNWVQVSQIAYYFNKTYSQTLYSYLDDDLTSSEMRKIDGFIKSKPLL